MYYAEDNRAHVCWCVPMNSWRLLCKLYHKSVEVFGLVKAAMWCSCAGKIRTDTSQVNLSTFVCLHYDNFRSWSYRIMKNVYVYVCVCMCINAQSCVYMTCMHTCMLSRLVGIHTCTYITYTHDILHIRVNTIIHPSIHPYILISIHTHMYVHDTRVRTHIHSHILTHRYIHHIRTRIHTCLVTYIPAGRVLHSQESLPWGVRWLFWGLWCSNLESCRFSPALRDLGRLPTCMYVCIYVRMYVCIHVCMYVSLLVCMYLSRTRRNAL